MAAIQLRGDSYRVIFRYQGQQHAVTIGKVSAKDATTFKNRTEELLRALDRGLRVLPPGCSITQFIDQDGKAPSAHEAALKTTLSQLREKYVAVMGNGAIETNSLATIRNAPRARRDDPRQEFPALQFEPSQASGARRS